jgi:4-amino-4-deoxy-L-arabinose transferase-like glycosyltransferase
VFDIGCFPLSMSRVTAVVIVFALWAAIYLPGLGSTEIKGEEGRRILPAVTMLETGNWVVPYLGGKPYLRKPPLMNWAIAGAFKVTGVKNEWTARLPSALAVLLLGLTIVATARRPEDTAQAAWLTPGAAVAAAIFSMTSFGLLAKARFAGAEIEGLYVPLFGIAITLWLAWWSRGKSAWLTWLAPGVFLGLGLLTKAPLHLLFFYGIVLAVLWRAKALRSLLHPAHFAALLLMWGMFAAWAVPYFRTEEANKAAKVWKDQFANRVVENRFDAGSYISNFPRGLGDLLPWLALTPAVIVAARRRPEDASKELEPTTALPVLIVSAGMLLVFLLIPGVLPRYVAPLSVSLALGAALLLSVRMPAESALWPRWHRVNQVVAAILILAALAAPAAAAVVLDEAVRNKVEVTGFDWGGAVPAILAATICFAVASLLWSRRPEQLSLEFVSISSGSIFAAAALVYGAVVPKWASRSDDLRPLAAQIDKAIPSTAELTIYDPGYQPALFYLRSRHRYAPFLEDIPSDAVYILIKAKDERKFAEKRSDLVNTFAFKRKGEPSMILLQPRSALGAGHP